MALDVKELLKLATEKDFAKLFESAKKADLETIIKTVQKSVSIDDIVAVAKKFNIDLTKDKVNDFLQGLAKNYAKNQGKELFSGLASNLLKK